jgi:hypothetical protein
MPQTKEQSREKNREAVRKYRAAHVEEARARDRQWGKENPDRVAAKSRKHREINPTYQRDWKRAHVREQKDRKYGKGAHQHLQKQLQVQGNKCGVCDRELTPGRGTNFDHCHATKKWRGALCTDCNLGLGRFNDRPEVMLKAIAYVEYWKGIHNAGL